MRSLLYDFAVMQNNDFVHFLDGAKTVGDYYGGAALHHFPERVLD